MIKTVLFDLAEVYIKGIIGLEKAIADPLRRTEKEIYGHLRQAELHLLFKGVISEDDYWDALVRHNSYPCKVTIEGKTIPVKDFLKTATRNNFTEIPGTADLVKRLKSSGYKVALVSDHAREWIAYYEEKFPINTLFEKRCYSFEEGLMKNMPRIYRRALAIAGAQPESTLYIDDRLSNIGVATSSIVGIKYWHQFTDAANLEEALKDFDINLF
jgi:HAD superfamily hydrolase (TIGR01509 family)